MIRIFIGYDPREPVAYNVLCHSIQTRANQPVSITPLMLSQLKKVMWRRRHELQSTDFSFSRFLLQQPKGIKDGFILKSSQISFFLLQESKTDKKNYIYFEKFPDFVVFFSVGFSQRVRLDYSEKFPDFVLSAGVKERDKNYIILESSRFHSFFCRSQRGIKNYIYFEKFPDFVVFSVGVKERD